LRPGRFHVDVIAGVQLPSVAVVVVERVLFDRVEGELGNVAGQDGRGSEVDVLYGAVSLRRVVRGGEAVRDRAVKGLTTAGGPGTVVPWEPAAIVLIPCNGGSGRVMPSLRTVCAGACPSVITIGIARPRA